MRLAVSMVPTCAPCFHNSSGLPLHTPLRLIRDGHSRHGLDGSHDWENDCQRINYIAGILLTTSRCCARAHEPGDWPLPSQSELLSQEPVTDWSKIFGVTLRQYIIYIGLFYGSFFGTIQSIDAPMFRNNHSRHFENFSDCCFLSQFDSFKVSSSHIW